MNASLPIAVTVSGIVTFFRVDMDLHALTGMVVMPLSKMTVSTALPSKQLLSSHSSSESIFSTVLGIVTVLTSVPLKIRAPIVFSPSGSVMLVRFSQFSNAQEPIAVTE